MSQAHTQQPSEPVAPVRSDAVNLARNMLEVRDCKGITSYGVRVLCEAVMQMHKRSVQQAAEPVAWPEHEFIQWGAKKYGPLLRAAIELLADVDNNLEVKDSPQKFGVPFGKLVALRAAIEASPPAPTQKPLTIPLSSEGKSLVKVEYSSGLWQWSLQYDGVVVRWLDEFESDFVDSAIKTALSITATNQGE